MKLCLDADDAPRDVKDVCLGAVPEGEGQPGFLSTRRRWLRT